MNTPINENDNTYHKSLFDSAKIINTYIANNITLETLPNIEYHTMYIISEAHQLANGSVLTTIQLDDIRDTIMLLHDTIELLQAKTDDNDDNNEDFINKLLNNAKYNYSNIKRVIYSTLTDNINLVIDELYKISDDYEDDIVDNNANQSGIIDSITHIYTNFINFINGTV